MTIYDDMETFITDQAPVGKIYALPAEAVTYLNTRRWAHSHAGVRAHDSAGKHFTWTEYAVRMQMLTPLIDMVAWELFYEHSKELNITVGNCLTLEMSPDPAHPCVFVKGYCDMSVEHPEDGGMRTMPEWVALAHEYAEDNDWDMTELYPAFLTITQDQLTEDMAEYITGFKGEEVELA